MKEKELNELRIALNLVGIPVDAMGVELFLEVQTVIKEKGEKFSLRDASEILAKVQTKYTK